MQVNADWQPPVYQVIGPVIRVHWDYSSYLTDEDEPRTVWNAQEAVVPVDADRATFVSIVNAEGGNGEALADGWFS